MKLIIDRFEGDFAVCEMQDGKIVNIPKIILDNATEGDIVSIKISKENNLKQENQNLLNNLFGK